MQCNVYQTTNGIFHRTRTKDFTTCVGTQKTLNSQSNLEKQKERAEEINFWTSVYITKLQSLNQYGTSTKADI